VIQVRRTAKPKVLIDNATKWTSDYLVAKKEYELDKSDTKKKKFKTSESKCNQPEIKGSLKLMFSDKCAYCESKITHIAYGEIEHYKPKSKYPNLCFEWDNMVFSCTICNGTTHKGDKFPLVNEGGPIINLVDENPDHFFKFDYDKQTSQALIIPLNERAKTTLNIFKFNDRQELIERRSKRTKEIITIKIIADSGNNEAKKLLNGLSEKDEYYAFIKAILY
jgi:uncharacterized protein (TIGR02646 family)